MDLGCGSMPQFSEDHPPGERGSRLNSFATSRLPQKCRFNCGVWVQGAIVLAVHTGATLLRRLNEAAEFAPP